MYCADLRAVQHFRRLRYENIQALSRTREIVYFLRVRGRRAGRCLCLDPEESLAPEQTNTEQSVCGDPELIWYNPKAFERGNALHAFKT